MKRILIVEDDKFIAHLCRSKFEEENFKVDVAYDGQAAIDSLKSVKPDAVLLDLMLPEVDGIGVLQFIRSDESLRDLPVIVLSNSSYFSGMAQSAWKAGATNFLNKADNAPKTLVAEIQKLLEGAPEQERDWNDPPPLPPRAFIKPAEGPIRVIIADDDRLIHGVLGFFMEQAGFLVRTAYDGKRALELAEMDAPDILILDGLMPELDGFEVLKIWQSHPKLAKVPVIMLTAEDPALRRSSAIATGAVEYVTKPFSPEDVVKLIRHYVGPR